MPYPLGQVNGDRGCLASKMEKKNFSIKVVHMTCALYFQVILSVLFKKHFFC